MQTSYAQGAPDRPLYIVHNVAQIAAKPFHKGRTIIQLTAEYNAVKQSTLAFRAHKRSLLHGFDAAARNPASHEHARVPAALVEVPSPLLGTTAATQPQTRHRQV